MRLPQPTAVQYTAHATPIASLCMPLALDPRERCAARVLSPLHAPAPVRAEDQQPVLHSHEVAQPLCAGQAGPGRA